MALIPICHALIRYWFVLNVLFVPIVIATCDFPETISEKQSDGSIKCPCDNVRGYCGSREDMCVKKECGENQILLRNCSCICQDNYRENVRGDCVAFKISRCKDGEIELFNRQCVMPSTVPTYNITTVTVVPTEYHQPPPEVKVTNVTSTSVTLGITIDLQKYIDALVIARIYKPRNESLLRQQETNVDPNTNVALMHIPNLTPNTSYTVAVRVFPKFARASATTIIQIQTYTYTEVFVRKHEENFDTDNNIILIVVIAVALTVILVIGLMVWIILKRRKTLKCLTENDAVNGDTENNDTDATDLESRKVPPRDPRDNGEQRPLVSTSTGRTRNMEANSYYKAECNDLGGNDNDPLLTDYANFNKNVNYSPIYPQLHHTELNTDERGQNEAGDATDVKSVDDDCVSPGDDVDITRRSTTLEMSIGSGRHRRNTSGPRSDINQPESQIIAQPNTMDSNNIQVITNRGHSPAPGSEQLGDNTLYHPSEDSNRESVSLLSFNSVRPNGRTQPTSNINTSLYNNE